MVKHIVILCTSILNLACFASALAATPTPQPTPPGGFSQLMGVQPCAIASDGHFYAAAYDLTAGGTLGSIDAWNEDVLHYAIPSEGNWTGIYLYDYTSQSWSGAEYALQTILIPTPTPVPSDLTIILPGNVPLVLKPIPSGTFLMGRYDGEQNSSENEDPQHTVTIDYNFHIAKYELTKSQWQAAMGTTPWSGHDYVLDDPDSPAVHVAWADAQAFIDTLNTNLSSSLPVGYSVRLPSEAEWEYTCRAGTTTRYYWGDDLTDSEIGNYAWYAGNTQDETEKYAHIVGQKSPNAWGVYDMSGNVWEWCQDWYHDSYTGAPTDGSAWDTPSAAWHRVVRGGSWGLIASLCRSANHGYTPPMTSNERTGFRIVAVPTTP